MVFVVQSRERGRADAKWDRVGDEYQSISTAELRASALRSTQPNREFRVRPMAKLRGLYTRRKVT